MPARCRPFRRRIDGSEQKKELRRHIFGVCLRSFLFFGTKHHILLAQPLPALLQEGGMVQAGGAEKLAGVRHTNFYGHIPLEHGEDQVRGYQGPGP